MAPIAASATRTPSNAVPLAISASIPNPTPTTPAAASAASSAPRFRSRCAGRSTNTIFFPCSSATSYFSEIRNSCCRSRNTSRSNTGSAWGFAPVVGRGTRFSRPHWGHFTKRPANSSFSSYDVPHWQVTRTPTVASVGESPNLRLDREAVTRRLRHVPEGGPMRPSFVLYATLAVATTASAQAPPLRPAPPAAPVLIKAGRLIDGRSDAPQSGVGILIEGDRIKAVGPL